MANSLAKQIYTALNANGAELGDASIEIIQKVLDEATFCIHCWGTGRVDDALHQECPDCNGTGMPVGVCQDEEARQEAQMREMSNRALRLAKGEIPSETRTAFSLGGEK